MPYRSIALLVTSSLLVSGCTGFAIASSADHYNNDDQGTTMVLGSMVLIALFAGIAISRAGDDDDKPDTPSPKVEPKDRVVYFAPSPSLGHEGEELRLQRMYVQGQVLARAGRCEGALAIGRNIERSSPAYFAVYAADPTIATCYRSPVDKLSSHN